MAYAFLGDLKPVAVIFVGSSRTRMEELSEQPFGKINIRRTERLHDGPVIVGFVRMIWRGP
jgi:hypothetical protein